MNYGESVGRGELTAEDELRIFEAGVKSDFWQLLLHRKRHILKRTEDELKAEVVQNRDFAVGRYHGHQDLVGYPERHIENLKEAVRREKSPH